MTCLSYIRIEIVLFFFWWGWRIFREKRYIESIVLWIYTSCES